MSTESAPSTEIKRYIGQVKWFNNKAGYGFITMTDETGKESDIFTHYTTVQVTDSQYKYLVQGEYVEFELTDSTNTQHQFQATNVTGINSGKLMCETRQANRSSGPSRAPRYKQRTDSRREEADDGFTKIQRRRIKKAKTSD